MVKAVSLHCLKYTGSFLPFNNISKIPFSVMLNILEFSVFLLYIFIIVLSIIS